MTKPQVKKSDPKPQVKKLEPKSNAKKSEPKFDLASLGEGDRARQNRIARLGKTATEEWIRRMCIHCALQEHMPILPSTTISNIFKSRFPADHLQFACYPTRGEMYAVALRTWNEIVHRKRGHAYMWPAQCTTMGMIWWYDAAAKFWTIAAFPCAQFSQGVFTRHQLSVDILWLSGTRRERVILQFSDTIFKDARDKLEVCSERSTMYLPTLGPHDHTRMSVVDARLEEVKNIAMDGAVAQDVAYDSDDESLFMRMNKKARSANPKKLTKRQKLMSQVQSE